MLTFEKLCFNCFQEKAPEETICSICGYDPADTALKFPTALPGGSILNGQYIVGRVLGQGGFGITYLAQDHMLKMKVAIKEYLPEGMATRLTNSTHVSVYYGEKEENFRYGAENFLDEARVLAKFSSNSNIANVRSYFNENNTSYFVMDFIEGISFKTYIHNQGGKIPWQRAVDILTPILSALTPIHNEGFIHRDVTPDNIYITKNDHVKLLDFGSARYSLGNKSKSLDVILKAGYAPKEQYMRRGKQGPYTDIYSISACLYASISGYLPPEALERMEQDDIQSLGTNGIDIPPSLETVIFKGLAVQAEDRYQSCAEFRTAILESIGTPEAATPITAEENEPSITPEEPPSVSEAVESSLSAQEPVVKPPKSAEHSSLYSEVPETPEIPGSKKNLAGKLVVLFQNKVAMIAVAAACVMLVVTICVLAANMRENTVQTAAEASATPIRIPSVLDAPAESAETSVEIENASPEFTIYGELRIANSRAGELSNLYVAELETPYQFDYAEAFMDGYARIKEDNRWGYIDTNFQFVVDPDYGTLNYYVNDYAIFQENGKYGYINRWGQEAIAAKYSSAYNFADGRAAVSGTDGKYYFIDENERAIYSGMSFSGASQSSEGFVAVADSRGKTYLDSSGNSMGVYFDDARMFSEGLAAVKVGSKWGYVDNNMNMLIDPQFNDAGMFTEGIAVVEDDEGMFHIDQSGWMIDEQKWDETWKYSDDYATVRIGTRYGYVNYNGKLCIPVKYKDVMSFDSGLCPVLIGTTWCYIDKDDTIVLDQDWDSAFKFTDGIARVVKNGKYGLIDMEGAQILPSEFEDILFIGDGLIPVKQDGYWGYYRITNLT